VSHLQFVLFSCFVMLHHIVLAVSRWLTMATSRTEAVGLGSRCVFVNTACCTCLRGWVEMGHTKGCSVTPHVITVCQQGATHSVIGPTLPHIYRVVHSFFHCLTPTVLCTVYFTASHLPCFAQFLSLPHIYRVLHSFFHCLTYRVHTVLCTVSFTALHLPCFAQFLSLPHLPSSHLPCCAQVLSLPHLYRVHTYRVVHSFFHCLTSTVFCTVSFTASPTVFTLTVLCTVSFTASHLPCSHLPYKSVMHKRCQTAVDGGHSTP
jgi:hypothetical protein